MAKDQENKVKVKVRFYVTAEVSLSKKLLEEVGKPEWQADLYRLPTTKDVANHVAYNLLQGRSLMQLDGFAHLQEKDAQLSDVKWDED